jgi:UDP-N-acetylmuramoylalanine--D-glutamate ligase
MLEFLKKKKIAILGMGVNNRHLSSFFSKKKIRHDIIKNWKSPKELTPKIKKYDVVFRTPGLPYFSEPINEASDAGVLVSSQTRLFFDLCPCPIIGVTGTKGKGTTASLLHSMLAKDGRRCWLAGNIGKDPFEFIHDIKKDDLVVLELSSFQLQDLHKSPHVAIVLSITADHVNPDLLMSTHYTQKEYVEAKSNILKHQTRQDFAVIHKSLPKWFKKLGKAKKTGIDPKSAHGINTSLLGRHNLENIAAAKTAAEILGVEIGKIKKAVSEFKALPHRLNLTAKKNGIDYVDDSISTNIDSTIAAIHSFGKPIVLIAGGYDKGHDYSILGETIKNSGRVKAVVVVGQVSKRIIDSLYGYKGIVLKGARNMKEIMEQAKSVAKKGDVVLLSPAAASFDMFKDAKDRGEQFVKESLK